MKQSDQLTQLFASAVWRLRSDETSLRAQIYRQLRDAITQGRIAGGTSVPSSRALSQELGVARSTLIDAFDQLRVEGYLVTSQGAATHVAQLDTRQLIRSDHKQIIESSIRTELGSTNGLWKLDDPPTPVTARAFRPGLPDLRLFPAREWATHMARRSRQPASHDLSYIAYTGVLSLRQQVAQHISSTRHVVTLPEQVIIVPSAQAAFDIVLRSCMAPGQTAWVEDPGYPGIRTLLRAHSLNIEPIAVDGEGLRPLPDAAPPQLIYLTPSHQYPTGVRLSLNRRLQLLALASEYGAVIIEDDYDSEFEMDGPPIASLQGLDRNGCVYYVGTFSKTLAPGIRCAYLIAPKHMLSQIEAIACATGVGTSIHVQLALADFMADGGLRRQIRRTRIEYSKRLELLSKTLSKNGQTTISNLSSCGGLQLCAFLKENFSDVQAAKILMSQGIHTTPVSSLAYGEEWKCRPGLLLGVGLVPLDEIEPKAKQLCELLKTL